MAAGGNNVDSLEKMDLSPDEKLVFLCGYTSSTDFANTAGINSFFITKHLASNGNLMKFMILGGSNGGS